MVIAQINVSYGRGSTGKIVKDLHGEYLRLGLDSHVLFGRGPKVDDPRIIRTGFLLEAKTWRFIQLFTGNFLGGSPLSTWNLKRQIKKLHPDVVHIHCINGNMCNVFSLLKWLKKNKYKTILTHHAKFMFTGGCGLNMCEGYAHGCVNCPRKKEIFGKFCGDKTKQNLDRLAKVDLDGSWITHTHVSPWLKVQAEKSLLFVKANNHVVLNPIDLGIFNSSGETKKDERPYAFCPTSAHSEVKGWQWVESVGKKLNELGLDLYVTGSGSETFASPNIKDIGYVADQKKLAAYYRNANVTLILSQCESFSMPVAESLCCGTPVCGFKSGGPESIGIEGACRFVEQGDLDGLLDAVKSLKDKRIDPSKAIDKYGREAVAKEFLSLYK